MSMLRLSGFEERSFGDDMRRVEIADVREHLTSTLGIRV